MSNEQSIELKPKAFASDIPVWCEFTKLEDIEKLIPNPRNYNKHSDKQIALLAKNIRAFGWRHGLVVSKRSGFIVSGHARLEAAKLLEVSQVPIEIQDYKNEAEEYAVLISDNRLAELAEPDDKMLKDLLSDLDAELGLEDIELTGYDKIEAENMMTGSGGGSDDSETQTIECPKCGHVFEK